MKLNEHNSTIGECHVFLLDFSIGFETRIRRTVILKFRKNVWTLYSEHLSRISCIFLCATYNYLIFYKPSHLKHKLMWFMRIWVIIIIIIWLSREEMGHCCQEYDIMHYNLVIFARRKNKQWTKNQQLIN